MTANQILLQKKYARIVELFAKSVNISLEDALDFFYKLSVYKLVKEGVSDMLCMSDNYIAEDLLNEYKGIQQMKMSGTAANSNSAII